eukprot:g1104.t1
MMRKRREPEKENTNMSNLNDRRRPPPRQRKLKKKPSSEEIRLSKPPYTTHVRSGQLTYLRFERSDRKIFSKPRGTVILCHGFPDNSDTFLDLAEDLSKSGYFCIVPLLRGYEVRSARVNRTFRVDKVAGDIVDLFDALQVSSAHLVGHDWGAAIVSIVARKIPQKVRSITMMAVPHNFAAALLSSPKQLLLSWYMFFFQIPILPQFWLLKWGGLEQLIRAWSPGWTPPRSFLSSVRSTLRAPGVAKAAIGYYRDTLGQNIIGRVLLVLAYPILILISFPIWMWWPKLLYNILVATKREIIPVPTLAMTGSDDGCIDSQSFSDGMSHFPELFPKGLTVKRLDNCGHWLHLEKPREVSAIIRGFLEEHTAGCCSAVEDGGSKRQREKARCASTREEEGGAPRGSNL